MTSFKTFALAGLLVVFASFISVAHADTIGCDLSYKSHDTYKTAHWEKVVKDLKVWKTKHRKYHPYYYTMHRKLVNAERHWKASKETRHSWGKARKFSHHWKKHKYHRYCKVNVSND